MTGIEWTDETWNPIHARRRTANNEPPGQLGWHCERVSPGCERCYAERQNMAGRFGRGTGLGYVRKSRALVDVGVDVVALTKPLGWRKPRRVFVCSMTDLFGEWVPDEAIDQVFAVMALAPQHTFQVLTKRPQRMREYLVANGREDAIGEAMTVLTGRPVSGDPPDDGYDRLDDLPLSNVWLGVSVEDQRRADERIPELLATPAAVRFLSCEPLLEAVDVAQWMHDSNCVRNDEIPFCICSESREICIDWVIAGGESGPGARPCDLAWLRSLRDQCAEAGVPFFCKQLGARPTGQWSDPDNPLRVTSPAAWRPVKIGNVWKLYTAKGGDPDEWPEDLRVREFPGVPA